MKDRREFVPPHFLDPPELPPDGFDPVEKSEDAARLSHFWLPDRPDERTEPDLYAQWVEMMRAPLRYVFARDEETRFFRSALQSALGGSRVTKSRNWSGALTVPNSGGRFTRVTGKWIVPKLKPGADPNPAGIDQVSTMWVGLDGGFPWSQGMPQVGSSHAIDTNGNISYHLWFQWWFRDFPSAEHKIATISIGADDEIYANISVLTPLSVLVHLANRTTKTFTTKKLSFSEGNPSNIPILGASAEWILERPSDSKLATKDMPNGPLFPLPAYDTIPVSRCATRMDNLRPPGWSPRLLRMAEIMPTPPHLILESVAVKRHQPRNSFNLEYKRPS